MTGGSAATWSFEQRDSLRIEQILQSFLQGTQARTALLIDRNGQLISATGEARPDFDAATFASLAAADFSANDQLAAMVGETEFASLFHQGERESIFLADVARRVILVVLFDARATLGLVRFRARAVVGRLAEVFEEVFSRPAVPAARALETGWASDAESEIDRLFGSL